jgi:chromosome segregation ATPase
MTAQPTSQSPDLARLAEDLGSAEHALRALLVEQEQLPAKLREAAAEADAERLVELRERGDRLPVHIQAARIRAARLRLSYLQGREVEAQAAAAPLVARVSRTALALRKAQAAHQRALREGGNAQAAAQGLTMDAAAAQRELDALEAELSRAGNSGPVVRAAFLAPKSAPAPPAAVA